MSFLAELTPMMMQGAGTAIAGAGVASLLMPKPSIPEVPNIKIPPAPTPDNPPLAPDVIGSTAAMQRARINRPIIAETSKVQLTNPGSRQGFETNVGSGAGTIFRTSLLGR